MWHRVTSIGQKAGCDWVTIVARPGTNRRFLRTCTTECYRVGPHNKGGQRGATLLHYTSDGTTVGKIRARLQIWHLPDHGNYLVFDIPTPVVVGGTARELRPSPASTAPAYQENKLGQLRSSPWNFPDLAFPPDGQLLGEEEEENLSVPGAACISLRPSLCAFFKHRVAATLSRLVPVGVPVNLRQRIDNPKKATRQQNTRSPLRMHRRHIHDLPSSESEPDP